MGYCTDYEIRVLDTNLSMHVVTSIVEQYFDDLFEDGQKEGVLYAYGVKWYRHEYDLAELSKDGLPDTLIEVIGYGERKGDIWRKFFRNGKVQRCETVIAFDPYDPTKLKDPK